MNVWTETVKVVGMIEMPIEEVLFNPDVHWDNETPYILEEEVIEISSLSELFELISKENITMSKKAKPVKGSTTKVEVVSAKVVLDDGTIYEGPDVEHLNIPDLPETTKSVTRQAVDLAEEMLEAGLVQEAVALAEAVLKVEHPTFSETPAPAVDAPVEEVVIAAEPEPVWEEVTSNVASKADVLEAEACLAWCAEQHEIYKDYPRARRPVGTIVDTLQLLML
jgi:hypothetical protein